MASIGSNLLNLFGFKDPAVAAMPGIPGFGGGGGARTPGGVAPASGAPAPAAPAQPQAYTSPPELLTLYNDLLGRQARENRINSGLGLIGSSFARPENRASIMEAMTEGGTGSPSDTLDLIMKMQELQKADEAKAVAAQDRERQLGMLPGIAEQLGLSEEAARFLFDNGQLDDLLQEASKDNNAKTIAAQDRERQLGMLPGIAEQYGLSDQTARLLFDNGQLDDFVQEASKPDVEIREDADGGIISVNKKDGTVKVLSEGYGPNADVQTYEKAMQDLEARGGTRISLEQWLTEDANRRTPKTEVNVNNVPPMSAADMKLLEAFDTATNEAFTKAQNGISTIGVVQEARRAMMADGGIIAGDITAPARLEASKMFGTLFPGFDNKAATNTEVMNSELKRLVLPRVKELGTGNSISNADREYVEKMVGNATLTQDALMRIMDITERGERREIIKANARMEARINASPEDSPLRKVFQPIQVPTLSTEYIQNTLGNVDRGDLTALLKESSKMSTRAAFDAAYGEGASRDVIEAATGMDPGPLTSSKTDR